MDPAKKADERCEGLVDQVPGAIKAALEEATGAKFIMVSFEDGMRALAAERELPRRPGCTCVACRIERGRRWLAARSN